MNLVNVFSTINDVLHNGSGGLLEGGTLLTLEYNGCCDGSPYEAIMWGVVGSKYSCHSKKIGETLEMSLLNMDGSLLAGRVPANCGLELKNLDEKMRVNVDSEECYENSFGVVAKKGDFGVIQTSLVYGSLDIFDKRVVAFVNKETFGESIDVLDGINIPDSFLRDAVLGERLRVVSAFGYSQKK